MKWQSLSYFNIWAKRMSISTPIRTHIAYFPYSHVTLPKFCLFSSSQTNDVTYYTRFYATCGIADVISEVIIYTVQYRTSCIPRSTNLKREIWKVGQRIFELLGNLMLISLTSFLSHEFYSNTFRRIRWWTSGVFLYKYASSALELSMESYVADTSNFTHSQTSRSSVKCSCRL